MRPKVILWAYALVTVAFGADVNENWWQRGVFYQIYPRSFKDSNGDGVGDLQGIKSKLEHLKDAGVTATWLSPICKSPQADQGYDISDYRDIHEEYGTLADMQELLDRAHELGIKVIMDFVPNHTSDEHDWFNKSVHREPGYENYYVWRDGEKDGPVPNNWLSLFRNSAWTYHDVRKQFYLHQFTPQQPDLNYREAAVQQELKDILTYWLDKGIDGFRIDAVPYLLEDPNFTDEPRTNLPNVNENDYEYLEHIYTANLPETYRIIYDWREHLDKYSKEHGGDARMMMTEGYASINDTMKYYGDGETSGAHFPFNFQFITGLGATSKAGDIVTCINTWLDHMPSGKTANWVLGNHDNKRAGTRLGVENVDAYNMIVAVLPGVAVTYYGEEIGMEDGEVTFLQGEDPVACNAEEEDFDRVSRDFERTPFHWDGTKNAGFSDGDTTWLPVSSKYLTNNLALQSAGNVASTYHVYQDLIKLRASSDQLAYGSLDVRAYSDSVLTLERKHNSESVFLVANIGSTRAVVNLNGSYVVNPELTVLIPSAKSVHAKGSVVESSRILLAPHESLVLYQKSSEDNESTTPGGSTGGGGDNSNTTSSTTTTTTTESNNGFRLLPQIFVYLLISFIGLI